MSINPLGKISAKSTPEIIKNAAYAFCCDVIGTFTFDINFSISFCVNPVDNNARLNDAVIALYFFNICNKLLGNPNVDKVDVFNALPTFIKSNPNILVAKLTPATSALIKSFVLLNVPFKKSFPYRIAYNA